MKRTLTYIGLFGTAGMVIAAYALASSPDTKAPLAAVTAAAVASGGGPFGLAQVSAASTECINCHRTQSPGIYHSWGSSQHYRANIGCYECHSADQNDPDAFLHYDRYIATIVSPKDCARCHSKEVEEFGASHHAKGARILGSLDNVLAEVVEGNRGMKTSGFPQGSSAAVVAGCWQCHGTEVKVLPNGKLDPATWPNAGIGRINPDGSEGSCTACHTRHNFSASEARHPDTCGKCHLGPDHPQKEIYEASKHGIAFAINQHKMNMESPKWIVGEDYSAAPTCATCHMSATKNQPITHDVGLRISWNNRPELSIRPEVADAKLNLPAANTAWQVRRQNMRDVCLNCHSKQWVDNFYTQYDSVVELYNEKFARPGLELYTLAKPLLTKSASGAPVEFGNKIDFTWYELWHHAGRRARHGASMMGPDYTHWHGTYELARDFYSEYIPQLQQLVETSMATKDPEKVRAAEALQAKITAVLNSEDHKWYVGKMDPEEAARRQKAAEEFKARYSK